ncbi:unnamed protein product [Pleuronectes platessa]|uniref:Uncharacterized protein n=1 Tax=Pleuronectes platessa TaxID=8262 RepID=A0A9N7Z2Y8_PLEPL|nr:unnamed protein product [Pleuronectes platessa]
MSTASLRGTGANRPLFSPSLLQHSLHYKDGPSQPSQPSHCAHRENRHVELLSDPVELLFQRLGAQRLEAASPNVLVLPLASRVLERAGLPWVSHYLPRDDDFQAQSDLVVANQAAERRTRLHVVHLALSSTLTQVFSEAGDILCPTVITLTRTCEPGEGRVHRATDFLETLEAYSPLCLSTPSLPRLHYPGDYKGFLLSGDSLRMITGSSCSVGRNASRHRDGRIDGLRGRGHDHRVTHHVGQLIKWEDAIVAA